NAIVEGMNERRVVLVEPDTSVPRAIDLALANSQRRQTTREPIELIACSTARAGLNACCALEPDCVVTALNLPDFDGLWLTESIRSQPGVISAVPIVMLAASDDEATRVRALKTGADVFVSKSLNVIELVAQVRALIAMATRVRERRSIMP